MLVSVLELRKVPLRKIMPERTILTQISCTPFKARYKCHVTINTL